MAEDLEYTEYRYGTDHELQNLGVWRYPDGSGSKEASAGKEDTKYWLVYIHGGAWRDPRVDLTSALPGINAVIRGSSNQETDYSAARRRIAGFASLNYRLSPHPDFPQGPQEPRPRAARHPDHLRDVRAALALLRRELGLGSPRAPYVLYGHSCGATLALQVLMGRELLVVDETAGDGDDGVPPPAAVVGFQGMYDLPALNRRFGDAYRGLLEGAFGQDEAAWAAASPARFGVSFRASLEGGGPGTSTSTSASTVTGLRVAALAYSPQDELIDMPEIDAMETVLRRDDGLSVLAYRDLEGRHDEVRKDGRYVARVLLQTLEELGRLERAKGA